MAKKLYDATNQVDQIISTIQAKDMAEAMAEVAEVEAKAALIDDEYHKGGPVSKMEDFPMLKSEHAKKIALEAAQVIEESRKKLGQK